MLLLPQSTHFWVKVLQRQRRFQKPRQIYRDILEIVSMVTKNVLRNSIEFPLQQNLLMSPISPVNQVKKSFDFNAQQQQQHRQHQRNDDNSKDALHFLLEISVCHWVYISIVPFIQPGK